jgi:hypothetical protein
MFATGGQQKQHRHEEVAMADDVVEVAPELVETGGRRRAMPGRAYVASLITGALAGGLAAALPALLIGCRPQPEAAFLVAGVGAVVCGPVGMLLTTLVAWLFWRLMGSRIQASTRSLTTMGALVGAAVTVGLTGPVALLVTILALNGC